MAELHVLAPRDGRTVEKTIESAKDNDMAECLILGLNTDGDFVFLCSGMGNRDALWLIEKARNWLMKDE